MILRRICLFFAAGLSLAAILTSMYTRSVSPSSAKRDPDVKDEAKAALSVKNALPLGSPDTREPDSEPKEISTGLHVAPRGTLNDREASCSALEELAAGDPASALDSALANADENLRQALLSAVLRGWAQVDMDAAGAWALSQRSFDRRVAFAALFSGAVNQPDEALRFAREIVRTHGADAGPSSDALIAVLCLSGEYEQAGRFATEAPITRALDQLSTVYRQWATQAPEPAWVSAMALPDRGLRLAAMETAVHVWAQTDPNALAEKARQSAPGPERTMALTMALRAWLEQDLEAASAWLMRWEPTGTLASVDLGLVIEE